MGITLHKATKVVKRLSVNRLPVKLPITGFDFQLPITDLPTFFFTSCNFRLQLRLHWAQTYRRHPTARSHWFMLTQRLTVESAPLPSPRRVAAAGKGGGGEEVRTGWPAWIAKTGVLLATNCCCMHAGCPA